MWPFNCSSDYFTNTFPELHGRSPIQKGENMFKLVALIKRKPGTSREEFVDYYENNHSKLGIKFLSGNAVKYMRRYFHPIAHPADGVAPEPEYDGLMELWFKDEEQAQNTLAMFAEPEVAKMLMEDEERFMDRSKLSTFIVEEHETEIPQTQN
jgi:hypothetical protein